MQAFEYRDGELYCEQTPLRRIAEQAGTPCWVYSSRAFTEAFDAYNEAFSWTDDRLICFALKSNANLSVARLLGSRGAGIDIVSRGEMFRALKAGIPGERIIYSGVGKSLSEIEYALENKVYCFNVESVPELAMIDSVAARLGVTAPVSMRINPDVESDTHEYTTTGKKETKFGIPFVHALESYREAAEYQHLRVIGIDTHIGSQIVKTGPFVAAYEKIARLFRDLRDEGFEFEFVDIGGGLGISYKDEVPPTPKEFAEAVRPLVEPLNCRVVVEPGRSISGNSGVLLTEVVLVKETDVKNFAIVNAGMNDLIRPSLYGSWHEIKPVAASNGKSTVKYDVVGPICESGDWLAKDRELPQVAAGDILCVFSAGAYGQVMSCNYNGRPRGAEVLVDGDKWKIVRKAETLDDLIRGEEF
jgi:diaminopimelate decarboxylase